MIGLLPSTIILLLVAPLTAIPESVLSVRVVPHKTDIVLGEPLIITTTVTNTGLETLKLVRHNAPTLVERDNSPVQLLLGIPGEPLTYPEVERNRWSDDLRACLKTSPISLEPGKSLTVDLIMLFNREKGLFVTQPGRYWVSGLVFAGTGANLTFVAPPVEFEVRAPSPADQSDWQWLKTQRRHFGRLVQIPWEAELPDDFLDECSRRFTTSQSLYVEYVALFLSRWYHEGPKKNVEEIKRWADIARRSASSEKMRDEANKLRR